jgi:hypothetical protein
MNHGAAAGLTETRHHCAGRVNHGLEVDLEDQIPDTEIYVQKRCVTVKPKDTRDVRQG